MENQNETQSTKTPQERVTIHREAASRIDGWVTELQSTVRGLKLTRSDVVNWLVQSHSDSLTSREIEDIKQKYFDEVEFTEWALRELKEARGRGEKLSLSDLLGRNPSIQFNRPSATSRKPRKQIVPNTEDGVDSSLTPGKEEVHVENQ
jgi:hypothetical protein